MRCTLSAIELFRDTVDRSFISCNPLENEECKQVSSKKTLCLLFSTSSRIHSKRDWDIGKSLFYSSSRQYLLLQMFVPFKNIFCSFRGLALPDLNNVGLKCLDTSGFVNNESTF